MCLSGSLVCTSESEEWKWKETAGTRAWGWAHGARGWGPMRQKRRGTARKERTRGGLCNDIIPHLHKSQSESWLVTGGRNRSRSRFSSFSMLPLARPRPQSVCACVRGSPSAVSFSAARRRASLLSPVDSQSAPNCFRQSYWFLSQHLLPGFSTRSAAQRVPLGKKEKTGEDTSTDWALLEKKR